MLGGHFDGIGGYPDDDREKLYVSVRVREGLFSTTKTPPAAALAWHYGSVAQRDGLGGLFFFMSLHVDCSCLVLRTQKLILLQYDRCC